MPESIRLTKDEQRALSKKVIEINKMLVKMEMAPIRDSELVHEILDKTVTYVCVDDKGKLIVDV